jgi:hypothetical protein
VNWFTHGGHSCQLPFYQRGVIEFEGRKMSLNSKRLSLADVRLKIFSEMEADLEAQFLELMELREQLREAELLADMQNKTRARGPRQLLSLQSFSVRGATGFSDSPVEACRLTLRR